MVPNPARYQIAKQLTNVVNSVKDAAKIYETGMQQALEAPAQALPIQVLQRAKREGIAHFPVGQKKLFLYVTLACLLDCGCANE
jgi:hypothetical protein